MNNNFFKIYSLVGFTENGKSGKIRGIFWAFVNIEEVAFTRLNFRRYNESIKLSRLFKKIILREKVVKYGAFFGRL
tara:strand:+ start:127 stop:354 length:228 start_codon:yes stop_codon:yes gene_type:complete